MFIRIFTSKTNATKFAETKKGKIEIKYSWDGLARKMIKEYMVKY